MPWQSAAELLREDDVDDSTRRLVSRAQLARYAEVSRAAVSTWQKRHPDFPGLADTESELFDLDQVIEWLSSRTIPANARHPHEPAGTTYADRVRLRVEADVPSPDQNTPDRSEVDAVAIEKTVRHALDALRGSCAITQGALLIGTLAFLEKNEHSHHSEPQNTPPSVVRTMVDLLATEEPLASVHDPYLRSGEFLTATVEAQSAFDSSAALRVSGSGPDKRYLGIAEMNMLLHGIGTESVRSGWPWNEDADSGTVDLTS